MHQQIPILIYADIAAAYDFLTAVFGLATGELVRDENGTAVHGEVHAGNGAIWLHQESEDYHLSSPRTLGAASSMMTVLVDDVDDHFARARDSGAEIVYEPVDQPYGYREYSARDPEGRLWSFMKSLD
jgi:uncharacterized glyoxalase superfamily protein PhnB